MILQYLREREVILSLSRSEPSISVRASSTIPWPVYLTSIPSGLFVINERIAGVRSTSDRSVSAIDDAVEVAMPFTRGLIDLSTGDTREFLEQACRVSISNEDFYYIYPRIKKVLEL